MLINFQVFSYYMAKVNFHEQMSVIRIRSKYAAPYLKHRYIYLSRRDVSSESTFKKAMNQKVSGWPDSMYYLKLSDGKVFVRFRIKNGRVTNIYKRSTITGNRYPIAEYIKK